MAEEEKIIDSKWEFIEMWCLTRYYRDAAEAAFDIEAGLKEAFGINDTRTYAWNKAYDESWEVEMSLHDLRDIIGDRSYCFGCANSNRRCERCLFGKRYGECGAPGSLFAEFLIALDADVWSSRLMEERKNDK